MARFGVTPRRSLGQHFVVDPEVVRRIARSSGARPGDRILEIGAGLGSLTLALVETGADVLAVEVDSRCAAALRHVLRGTEVTVIEEDVASLDLGAVLEGGRRWMLVANLPYNIATPLVLGVLSDVASIETMVVMVQREAGERLAAPPRSRARAFRAFWWSTAAPPRWWPKSAPRCSTRDPKSSRWSSGSAVIPLPRHRR